MRIAHLLLAGLSLAGFAVLLTLYHTRQSSPVVVVETASPESIPTFTPNGLLDYSVESTDDDADCDLDSETGADEDADTYTYPDVYGTVETLKRLRPMDPNADRDSRPDVDTITDYRPVSGDACGWGLPAVLLHRVGD
jgi:hypothetical protein